MTCIPAMCYSPSLMHNSVLPPEDVRARFAMHHFSSITKNVLCRNYGTDLFCTQGLQASSYKVFEAHLLEAPHTDTHIHTQNFGMKQICFAYKVYKPSSFKLFVTHHLETPSHTHALTSSPFPHACHARIKTQADMARHRQTWSTKTSKHVDASPLQQQVLLTRLSPEKSHACRLLDKRQHLLLNSKCFSQETIFTHLMHVFPNK